LVKKRQTEKQDKTKQNHKKKNNNNKTMMAAETRRFDFENGRSIQPNNKYTVCRYISLLVL